MPNLYIWGILLCKYFNIERVFFKYIFLLIKTLTYLLHYTLSCKGQGYSCQSSYPASSCLRTSECVGDGTCRYKMRSNGTVCRPAVDNCDQPERYFIE